ncbi:dinitrogenase iron-molybdenum cofactor biosynthesis protein [Billgrantia endophytica]|uniref:Dinitrogenase iron-molybdenum cofactor biosynthesis protein n=1 Tax=Billgrantia endophytica TaxID=2033802 RepID=A0A2N7U0G3_9GAMM|nr:dinitrogenase iron-molybdenum cofactor biosynthesis protein [Halomonas endophytica]PMR73927.1 dinitrogenase iron-molybdenum cofactor biosynthesis protein [Halomonas endophytica]
MNRETALRIALAARAMPGISVGQLLDILHQRIEGELTEEALQTVTVTDLKTGFASADGEEDGEDIGIGLPALKNAVRILWGESVTEDLPQPVALEQLPEGSIRVAIASNSGEQLDGHFGSCLRFLIYQVGADSRTLVDIRSAHGADTAEDKNAFRAELIADCQVLYIVSIGGPAAAKVVKTGIYPIKRVDGGQAEAIITELQGVMSRTPPPWLAKLLGVAAEERVRFSLSDEDAARG